MSGEERRIWDDYRMNGSTIEMDDGIFGSEHVELAMLNEEMDGFRTRDPKQVAQELGFTSRDGFDNGSDSEGGLAQDEELLEEILAETCKLIFTRQSIQLSLTSSQMSTIHLMGWKIIYRCALINNGLLMSQRQYV